jgi:hypothetical protein
MNHEAWHGTTRTAVAEQQLQFADGVGGLGSRPPNGPFLDVRAAEDSTRGRQIAQRVTAGVVSQDLELHGVRLACVQHEDRPLQGDVQR